MSLNLIENSDVIQFIETVNDEKIKELLNRLHSEYSKYIQVGTPEECMRYKEWCDLKPSDYMRLLDNCTRTLKDELECTENFYKKRIIELEDKIKRRKTKVVLQKGVN